MKTSVKPLLFILVLSLSFCNNSLLAQASEEAPDCNQFSSVYEDAKNEFQAFLGENSTVGYDGMVTDYDFTLWGSESSEHVESYMFGGEEVDFTYGSFNDLASAKTRYEQLLEALLKCMPENYQLTSDVSGGTAVYQEFSSVAQPEDPVIAVMVEEFGQAYRVKISFSI